MDVKIGEKYNRRIEAMEFAVKYDDGKDLEGIYLCDILLIGISRTSKTPLSMYLASKGIKVCNLPISPRINLPKQLYEIDKEKIVGLIISEERVACIRRERLLSLGIHEFELENYIKGIKEEIEYAKKLYEKLGCIVIDVSDKVVEEVALIIQSKKEV